MYSLQNINLNRFSDEKVIAFIEIPGGSKKKYEMDKETGYLFLDRYLKTSFRYPVNYGFIPLTLCDDNDPLDIFVLSQEALDPMVLVECYPIGIIKMIDNNELDDKIIAVPTKDFIMEKYRNINDLPSPLLSEIKHFLLHYKDLENKNVIIKEILDKAEALLAVKTALNKYQKNLK
ncbi:inorganic diphosphatase [Candidatus Phytoplasma melaleucae]|uniref:Inorganic pyrophosphatase n=1 Tax=Candidatus Phytoplasma melaleucae TaxID=2982630 RepID=A0ABT9DF86_9MOLU|nr:inorganic diphosphatase ['Melaleuca sp.' phytoplasma]MDO8167949.1 inorganic diphosphatase ['Melaleuca sp.' phytoplasma]MDV3205143.1 inorganic diphosphatase [Weeping tea tree witches'-broom phytoplasma]